MATLAELCSAHHAGSAASVSRITGIPLRTLNDWVASDVKKLGLMLISVSTARSMSSDDAGEPAIRFEFIKTVANRISDLLECLKREDFGYFDAEKLEFYSNILRRACNV